MKSRILQIDHMSQKMKVLCPAGSIATPPTGWVKAVRTALGMSMEQLGKRLGVTKQSIHDVEQREKEGSVTIRSLSEIANALDMKLVYGFIPKDGTLDALIDRKARELAEKIVLRTAQNMRLEAQENSAKRIEKAIMERKAEIKRTMPRMLWD
ncbi:MAG: XRE family transcriptional regulator [Prosthecochloris sp.]|nr:XRE family transcriptional regulator [Prosthecochloris sp.]